MTKTVDQILATLPHGSFREAGKFAPKLNFHMRCEILALYRRGVGRNVLAAAFGVNRRTITHIHNPASPHYKRVRDEWERLGKEEFERTYITEEGVARISAIHRKDDDSGPNKRANRDEGIHKVRGTFCSYDHRIEIRWRDDGHIGPGWYYQDLDGPAPELWSYTDEESITTSTNCFKALLEEIVDKE